MERAHTEVTGFTRLDDQTGSSSSRRSLAILLFTVAALGVTGLDLWSKKAVWEFLAVEDSFREMEGLGLRIYVESQTKHKILENFFWLEANYNYGAFSGWLSRSTKLLAALSTAAVGILLGVFVHHVRLKKARPELLFVLALGLLLGGTLGNLHDRALLGAVRDWVRWFVVWNGTEHIWPNFNVADSAICTGVGLLVLLELRKWRREVAGRTA